MQLQDHGRLELNLSGGPSTSIIPGFQAWVIGLSGLGLALTDVLRPLFWWLYTAHTYLGLHIHWWSKNGKGFSGEGRVRERTYRSHSFACCGLPNADEKWQNGFALTSPPAPPGTTLFHALRVCLVHPTLSYSWIHFPSASSLPSVSGHPLRS